MADEAPTPEVDAAAEVGKLHAALQAARAQGLPEAEPMRWRRIEALARRTTAHEGATRALLEARLWALLGDASPPVAPIAPVPAPAPATQAAASALGTLLAQLQGAASPSAADAAAAPTAVRKAPRELKVVRQHRAAWTQLRAEQRVAEAHTALPDQAGPLNSQLLLHRALSLMRETAPGYLQHFTAQAEALMWLEHAQAAPSAEPRMPSRGPADKAPARGRAAVKKTPGRSARR